MGENYVSEAYKKGYSDGYIAAMKAYNRPSDERSTTAWMNMPEASDKTETERLADRTLKMVEELYDKLTRLQGNLCKVERKVANNREDINTLWDHMLEDEGIRDKK